MSEYVSIKKTVLQKLEESLPELAERFDVAVIGIFGSVSRGEDTKDSDVDILYAFKNGGLPLRDFFAFRDYLTELFGRQVDLVPIKWIEPGIQPFIEQDMILYSPQQVSAEA